MTTQRQGDFVLHTCIPFIKRNTRVENYSPHNTSPAMEVKIPVQLVPVHEQYHITVATIMDTINGTSGPPLPPFQ